MDAGRQVTVDIELTNRCNATCDFCPRDRTPQQGRMTADTFEQLFGRVVDFREQLRAAPGSAPQLEVSFCGLGEPLLHSSIADYVRRFRAIDIPVAMSSNASLLDEVRGQALIDAGLNRAFLNVGALEDDYEALYGLPFERTRDNVVRFREMSNGRCKIHVVVVNHDGDDAAAEEAARTWRALGLKVNIWTLINRAGSLPVAHMGYQHFAETAQAESLLRDRLPSGHACGVPLRFHFVGWNGQYYLCSSDWEKRASHGHVATASFADAAVAKLATARSRRPICAECTHDPVNRVAVALRAARAQPIDEFISELAGDLADESTLTALGIDPGISVRQRLDVVAVDEVSAVAL